MTLGLTTFQALAVALVAILPGAVYTFGFERSRGSTQQTASDRFVRFFFASAVLHAVFFWAEFWLFRTVLERQLTPIGVAGYPLWAVELVALAYVGIPLAFGLTVGSAGRIKGGSWLRRALTSIEGSTTEPRAWDDLWARRPYGYVRLKLKDDGPWIGGYYGSQSDAAVRSYAAGFPATGSDLDLLLTVSVQLDADTGEFKFDDNDELLLGAGPLLVRWDEVQYLEMQVVGADAPALPRTPSPGRRLIKYLRGRWRERRHA